MDGKPLIGTTTALNIISKPLTWWASGKALEQLGWTNPKLVKKEEGIKIAGKARKNFFINNVEYYDWLQECYRAHNTTKTDAAKDGVDLHAELEKFVKSEMDGTRYEPIEKIIPFVLWSRNNVKRWVWSEGYCYSEILWVGGISDAGAEMNNGKLAVFDFKSSKDAYFSQFVQDGGYSLQIEENGVLDPTGNLMWTPPKPFEELYVVPFGAEDSTPRPHYDVQGRKRSFMNAVELYKDSELFAKK